MVEPQEAQTGKARWSRLAALGFGLGAGGAALLLIAGAIFGLPLDDFTFFLIPLVILGALSFIVLRFGTWSKITGIVLGTLAALSMFWMVFGIFVPGNFFDFVPGLMFIPGTLLGVGSCIAALVAKRRGHLTPVAEAGEARGIRIVLIALVALALLSGVLTLAGRKTADATAAAETITIKNFKFLPSTVTVAGGSKLFVDNNDPFLHTFTVKDLDIDEAFNVGTSKLITIPEKPGRYYFYCEPHAPEEPEETPDEDQDMNGFITVT